MSTTDQQTGFYQKILCPVDYSPHAVAALKHAVAIADSFKAKIILMNVFQLPDFVSGAVVSDELLEIPRRQLKEFAEAHAAEHVALETHIIMGHTGDNIIETAREIEADLIVMGSHGYSGLTRLILGGTAAYVLEHSNFPTLIIRV